MVFFFTSVGFQANLKVLKSGGKSLIVFLGLVIALILCQNFIAIGLAKLLHISPLVGLCTGSIPMIGGHGTAGAFGPVLEDFGVKGASTLCTAAATFGLIAGSIMGGPVGKRLIEKKDYIKNPKPSGYRSLHLIVQVPIFLQKNKKMVNVEVQFRTIAMDFWASLEHKLRYKKDIPADQAQQLQEELLACATQSAQLDNRMQEIRNQLVSRADKGNQS